MAALALGCGLIISALTTTYRDLAHLVAFGVQLWMFATPVVYPMSIVPHARRWLFALNPMTSVVETVRYMFLGAGTVSAEAGLIGFLATALVLAGGVLLFSRVERSFMDVV
jgi:lipopolysaccharide transport system permease protein